MGEMTTPESKASLVERLRLTTMLLAGDPVTRLDEASMMFVADMTETIDILAALEELLGVTLADEAQEDPSSSLGEIINLAGGLRDRLDKANPEPGEDVSIEAIRERLTPSD